MTERFQKAMKSLQEGKFVLVYDADGREEETDMVIASKFISPDHVRRMRRDAGGLICMAMAEDVWKRAELPFMVDVLQYSNKHYPVINKMVPDDIPYDSKSSFGLTINHRKTFTGITDIDRAMTMKRFAELAEDPELSSDKIGNEFRSPGHIHLLNASKLLLHARQGHTELSIALLKMAEVTPVSSICEMMGDDGRALSKEKAEAYANEHGLVFLEGSEVIEGWNEWSE